MNTKHLTNCKRVFKNYDPDCPRCSELASGAKSRDGWQKDYYTRKKREEDELNNAIKNHSCKKSGCIMCTAFDW